MRHEFGTGEVDRRLYLNPRPGEDYGPRVTFWTATRTLKVEFSAEKMGAGRDALDDAIKAVDERLSGAFGTLPSVQGWTVQRVDYATNLLVGEKLSLYLAALGQAQLAGFTRHVFAGSGVVWKSRGRRGRWVKFYTRPGGVLRFEVSSYKDATRYMAGRWFGCERTVAEMSRPGRALFVLAREWERLGLGGGGFGQQVSERGRLRDAFGVRGASSASYVLELHREYGSEAYRSLGLVSKSTYYRRLRELREQGFLVESERADALDALELPCESVFALLEAKNLESRDGPPATFRASKTWAKLCGLLEISAKNRPNNYLLESWRAYEQKRRAAAAVESAPGPVSAGGRERSAGEPGQSAVT